MTKAAVSVLDTRYAELSAKKKRHRAFTRQIIDPTNEKASGRSRTRGECYKLDAPSASV